MKPEAAIPSKDTVDSGSTPPHWASRAARLVRSAPFVTQAALLVILFYAGIALTAGWIAPYGESEIAGRAYMPPSAEFWLGTDQLGRDMLSRMIYGARNTIGIVAATTLLSFAIGVPLGIFSALRGGWVAQGLGAVVEVIVAVPTLVFALMFLAVAGRSTLNLLLIIAVLDAARVYLISRTTSVGIIALDYVEAARLRGEGNGWIMFREVLPNMASLLAAEFGLRFGFVFLTISALSFLGIGIQPPTADWGSMIADSKSLLMYGVLTPVYPAVAIVLLTVAVNFVVDWMQRGSLGQDSSG